MSQHDKHEFRASENVPTICGFRNRANQICGMARGAAIHKGAPAESIDPPAESIFDLSFRGALPDMLRAIADKIEGREVDAEQFQCSVTKEVFELSARVVLHPKG